MKTEYNVHADDHVGCEWSSRVLDELESSFSTLPDLAKKTYEPVVKSMMKDFTRITVIPSDDTK